MVVIKAKYPDLEIYYWGEFEAKEVGDVSLFFKLMGPRLLYQPIAIFPYFIVIFLWGILNVGFFQVWK